ncbi:hypothetical protein A2Z22_00540 [Candidatus Woesebacteria bacterium RBG_16_34_12]|uniref:PDZ domain-containing protein n=1 Tax=Candidatus Woesebacteria bacterium RBG_16_34_12 TaxID=1802480 RepID=A0A1F7X910_9BACT|nr:MAG: hypothetical protein A2Z22_00540 [Candidatus Woesebacteria bacterium RBG_16_34_12]
MQIKFKIPKVSLILLRRTFLLIIIVCGIFSFGYVLGAKGYRINKNYPNVIIQRENPSDKKDLNFSLFWKVWDTLQTSYFDKNKLIPAEMVYGAIKGMVASIGDPYTVFLAPSENKVVQEDLQGSFEGIGIQIGFKGTQLAVIAPLPESPAEKAEIRAGDFIVGIKDERKGINMGTSGITLPEAVQVIRGQAGTEVTLSLLREGSEEVFEKTITRESIEVPSVTLKFVGEKEDIAHIKVLKFVAETSKEWDDAVIEILKKPEIDEIIVDVRNDPGGYLQSSVDLASDFLEIGQTVVSEEHTNGSKDEFKVEKIGRLKNKNAVVLVNKGSASASEILAGALKDLKKYKIIGETTFGKGTIQEPQQIDNGAGLHITVARWLTPSGYWVDGKGIVPDIEVKDNPDTNEDEQLQEAINYFEGN